MCHHSIERLFAAAPGYFRGAEKGDALLRLGTPFRLGFSFACLTPLWECYKLYDVYNSHHWPRPSLQLGGAFFRWRLTPLGIDIGLARLVEQTTGNPA